MKKGFFCLIITLCLFGCQINPTTEEILRTQKINDKYQMI